MHWYYSRPSLIYRRAGAKGFFRFLGLDCSTSWSSVSNSGLRMLLSCQHVCWLFCSIWCSWYIWGSSRLSMFNGVFFCSCLCFGLFMCLLLLFNMSIRLCTHYWLVFVYWRGFGYFVCFGVPNIFGWVLDWSIFSGIFCWCFCFGLFVCLLFLFNMFVSSGGNLLG